MCLSLVFYYPARPTAPSVLCFDFEGKGGREGREGGRDGGREEGREDLCLFLVFYYPARPTAFSVLCFDYEGEERREGGREEPRRFPNNTVILIHPSLPHSLPPSYPLLLPSLPGVSSPAVDFLRSMNKLTVGQCQAGDLLFPRKGGREGGREGRGRSR